jgi:hypothetical protein
MLLLTACSETATWKLRESNDYFTALNNDHAYTQGLELSRKQGRDTIGVGQDIYTPASKREYIPPKNERSYAGYLYAYGSRTSGAYTYTIKPGWIGPGALGKEAQCGVHKILGQYCPYGWATQIRNRPTLQGMIEKEWNYEDTTLLAGANAGTPITSIFFAGLTKICDFPEISTGPRLEVIAHDSFLDSSESTVSKRLYRASIFLRARVWAITYFLAVESPTTKESSEPYNYGGIEITW